ncbi:6,7-dimethyl-8-ribityllumazine synthase [Thermosipho melanesiensis]|uniref:6,7-dimethyl-8-ribityllumazine synthase n=2 Tax=Thermosipho melanesiensis TaxID=46541 RepID=A6LJ20_THEM4|nr:6,7-dimethyl-8-ribityllumazine synthase [Thermosipho melanesiensis]ABR29921.1 Riboflavin synthase [Thermosipho melanesiensis BI429]APT73129.1 6,7-dimethyl-8-ribityllumazine synthase [Thermosipho melanesiensis]OOC38527.1 6,7-dimethyl-8-ribityllumazine synthase [Thermosipho melanesiensis]OOC40331.1 6,7-dimethyl-8-ribityllumazine synthase [Thermosipho melanesiensis]OOC40595.1 6,7-dimethyl-8-ribityllumazine synthase [Thermosipho melanesiensis]
MIEGKFYGCEDLKIGIVLSRFNSQVTERLLKGALDCLKRHGISNIDIVKVPGSMEIGFVLKRLINKDYDALIALGAIIRGETYHFDVVANEISKAVMQLNLEGKVPISFGILTTDTLEQAINRSGAKSGNKGFEAAMVAIEMAQLKRQLI